LTQEQVAERLNVSIHTFRRWDRDRNRPSGPQQMQLLAAVLGTRIGVIWPATDDPLVVEALRIERRRTTPERATAAADRADEAAVSEVQVRRWRPASIVTEAAGARERLSPDPVPSVERDIAADDAETSGSDDCPDRDAPGGLPPWPVDFEGEASSDEPGSAVEFSECEPDAPRAPAPPMKLPPRGGGEGVVTLRAVRSGAGRQAMRGVVAIGAAFLVGVAGMAAASALGERSGETERVTQPAAAADVDRARVAVRARDVASMRAAASRGDYDAAIRQARQLQDAAAVASYRGDAARVLVGRADKAARRGDLPLARARLRTAKERYGTAPGSAAVQARVRRIERQRKERARRAREAARRAAAAAAQPAAATAERASGPSEPSVPAPSASGASQSSAPSPSGGSSSSGAAASSSAAKGSGSRKKDPERAVDPGVYWDGG
jgi:transcriptional regulator with XRE-family HTH domain